MIKAIAPKMRINVIKLAAFFLKKFITAFSIVSLKNVDKKGEKENVTE